MNLPLANEDLAQARARNVSDALAEDIGQGDLTARLIDKTRSCHAQLIVRESAVLCGVPWFEDCFRALDPDMKFQWHKTEGSDLAKDDCLCDLRGKARAVLTAERSALNFLQMLSAVATQTRLHVEAIRGVSPRPAGALVLDTRKTLPGLRQAQKYAVRIGGGTNQRMALWDGILIKENHIHAAGGISQALSGAQALDAGVPIQIEVENLDQLGEALAAGAQSILLDNFSLPDLERAVALTAGRALLEASGGIDIASIKATAKTGVDRISVGRLTKDIRAIDYSLRILD